MLDTCQGCTLSCCSGSLQLDRVALQLEVSPRQLAGTRDLHCGSQTPCRRRSKHAQPRRGMEHTGCMGTGISRYRTPVKCRGL